MKGPFKVLSGAALGTIISISSLTSAHAAVLHKEGDVVQQTTKQEQTAVTEATAQKVALKNCSGVIQSTSVKTEKSVTVYVVKILGEDGKQHTLKVNSHTGKIIKHETTKKEKAINKQTAQKIALKHVNGVIQSSEMKKEDQTYVYVVKILGEDGKQHVAKINCQNGKVISQQSNNQTISISKSKAETIALSKTKGAIQSVQLKKDTDAYVYVIKVLGEDGKAYTYHINCDKGQVMKQKVSAKAEGITKQHAKEIALNNTTGVVKNMQLKKEGNVTIYVIKVVDHSQKETTVKINANTGKVCS